MARRVLSPNGRSHVYGSAVLQRVDLKLEPNEASDLCQLHEPRLLAAHGWDASFLTVLDEAPAEDAIVLLGHDAGAVPTEGWSTYRLRFDASDEAGRSDDAEVVTVRSDGQVYVLGSHYGSKTGPLEPKRQWIARFDPGALVEGVEDSRLPLELVRTEFRLHRAVNDALAAAGVALFDIGPQAREALIDGTRRAGQERGETWVDRVRPDDSPINIEGATFLPEDRLLLGLRFPTTADGHPLLVEVVDIDVLFEGGTPRCGSVWSLEIGSHERPVGVRAMSGEHVIVGSLDAAGKDSVLLADHPEAGEAGCAHWRRAPLPAGGGTVGATIVHDFGDLRRVEGVADGIGNHHLYVVDEESGVQMRFLLVE